MQRVAVGQLSDSHVIIDDPKSGSRLYNRGTYGTPMSGGGLKLELIEGFYLLENEKIRIVRNDHDLDLERLLTHITKREPTFEIKYIVYRDLRQRGHLVKPSNVTDFVIYDTTTDDGTGISTGSGKKHIKYWSQAVSERAQFNIAELSEQISTAKGTRKGLVIAVVDEEGDLTYYRVETAKPKGRLKHKLDKVQDTPGTAVLVEDRVMLWEPGLIAALRATGFFGKVVGSSLQLALTESVYLMDKGVFDIRLARTKRKLKIDQFMRIARKIQPDFDRRLVVYRELKSRDLIVKTGFKYGTHFRVYEGDPENEHSEFLVHSVPRDFVSSWEEISRAVRLAQGVRKQMLFARILDEKKSKVEYINIERIKP